MKKTTAALLLALLAPATALAADVLEKYQVDQAQAEESVLGFMLNGPFWVPPATQALRAVPAGKRAEVVRLLGKAARAFTETPLFVQSYLERRAAAVPGKPEPAKDGKALAAERNAQFEESLKSMEESLPTLTEDQQAQYRTAMAQIREAQKSMAAADTSAIEAAEQQRFQADEAAYRRALEELPPESPREGVRAGLRRFLKLTAGVDFAAKLVESDGVKRFANPDYDEKPPEWKLCFRAGKEATEAARAFAQEWLKELK